MLGTEQKERKKKDQILKSNNNQKIELTNPKFSNSYKCIMFIQYSISLVCTPIFATSISMFQLYLHKIQFVVFVLDQDCYLGLDKVVEVVVYNNFKLFCKLNINAKRTSLIKKIDSKVKQVYLSKIKNKLFPTMQSISRTPSQSLHYLRGSRQTYATPEKLVKVHTNSGVKHTPLSKSIGNHRLKSENIETITKQTDQQKIHEYIQELESKIMKLEQQSQFQSSEQQQELERRILELLNENYHLKQSISQNENLNSENEQLKQLIFEQQTKILQQQQEFDQLQMRYKRMQKDYQNLSTSLMNGLEYSVKKHCSFTEYFKQQKPQ